MSTIVDYCQLLSTIVGYLQCEIKFLLRRPRRALPLHPIRRLHLRLQLRLQLRQDPTQLHLRSPGRPRLRRKRWRRSPMPRSPLPFAALRLLGIRLIAATPPTSMLICLLGSIAPGRESSRSWPSSTRARLRTRAARGCPRNLCSCPESTLSAALRQNG